MLFLLRNTVLFVALTASEAVKVNMMGSLSLGKDVMAVLADYLRTNLLDAPPGQINARRMLSDIKMAESMVSQKKLCRDMAFCSGNYKQIINEYVVSLYKAVAEIFVDIIQEESLKLYLKQCLRNTRKILKHGSLKINDENEVRVWTEVFKRMSSSFLETATQFLAERLEGTEEVKGKVTRILIQQLVVAIVRAEMEYRSKLCTAHSICVTRFTCKNSLKMLLESLKDLPGSKVKVFVNAFHENLKETPLFLRLDEPIRNEFERILEDTAESNEVSAKKILSSIRDTVELNVDGVESDPIDVVLIHSILSDMDHAYDSKRYPFEEFLGTFDDWVKDSARLEASMKNLMKGMTNQLSQQSPELIFKLTEEVKVFLELTIGHEFS